MRFFGSRKPLPPLSHYGVDTPTASESVSWRQVVYRAGPVGDEYEVEWELLTSEERLELDRLLWKARRRKPNLRALS